MNEDAEKWIAENCDGHNERMIAGEAMRWAYADAAKQVEVAYWQRYAEDEGTPRHVKSIVSAIEERMR